MVSIRDWKTGLWTKFGLLSVFINKVEWNTVTPIHLHVIYKGRVRGCMYYTRPARLSSCNKYNMTHKT